MINRAALGPPAATRVQIPPAAPASQPHLLVAARVEVLPQGPLVRKGPVADPAGALPGCGVREARVVWTGARGVAIVAAVGHGGGGGIDYSFRFPLDKMDTDGYGGFFCSCSGFGS